MIIQEVIDDIIEQLKAQISPLLGGASVQGDGLVMQGPDGRVMSIVANKYGERKDLTISDNKTPRFYIRLLAPIQSIRLEGGQRYGSCGNHQKTAQLKLVFMDHCKDVQKLLLALESSLFNMHFDYSNFIYGAKKVDILSRSSNYIPWEIYNQETLKPKKDFHASSLQLCSINFDLRVATNFKNCLENKLC